MKNKICSSKRFVLRPLIIVWRGGKEMEEKFVSFRNPGVLCVENNAVSEIDEGHRIV